MTQDALTKILRARLDAIEKTQLEILALLKGEAAEADDPDAEEFAAQARGVARKPKKA